jgi:hypothetical protein
LTAADDRRRHVDTREILKVVCLRATTGDLTSIN